MMPRKSTLAAAMLVALAAAANASATPATADTVDAAADPSTLETVTVTVQGETRQVQRITPDDARALPPGASPLKVLDILPGVHFESSDPFGAYEWSTRISLRGFNQNRLGFTLDGVPLGDMSYGNNNGLHISRALISENIAQTELAQGIGALGMASTNDLGGGIQFHSSDPRPEYGVEIAQTIGSDSTRRTYARLDTGDHGGFAMYLSGAYSSTDKWKGWGDQGQTQFNGKAVYDFNGGNRVSLLVTTSRRDEVDYADLSLAEVRNVGYDFDNFAPNWQAALNAAACVYGLPNCALPPVNGPNTPTDANDNLDAAYYLGRGVRNDDLVNLAGDFTLGEGLNLHAQAYYHKDRGQGHWWSPYQPSSAAVPISIRTTEYGIDRNGVIAALDYELGIHRLEAGFWYENSGHNLQRNYYFIGGPIDDSGFLRNPDVRVFYQHFDTDTRQFYIQDSIKLFDDRLAIDAGFKMPDTTTQAKSLIGTRASGELEAKKNFLPQIGASFKLTDTEELFGSYAKNIAAFQPGVSGPFSASASSFAALHNGKDLKPEESKTFEGGLRSVHKDFEASLALYSVKFDNRLLAISQCAGIVGCPTGFANVGGASSRGAEITFVWKPTEHLRWFNSLSFNNAEYDSNYLDGKTLVQTDGKTQVDSPERMFASQLAWHDGPFEISLEGKYESKRYYTYLNDAAVPGFWLFNLSAAYDFGPVGPLRDLNARLNVTNLADKNYFGTIGSNGFLVSDPTGQYYTLQAGAPRQAFLSLAAKF